MYSGKPAHGGFHPLPAIASLPSHCHSQPADATLALPHRICCATQQPSAVAWLESPGVAGAIPAGQMQPGRFLLKQIAGLGRFNSLGLPYIFSAL